MDVRVAINEAFGRKSKNDARSARPASTVPALPKETILVHPSEALQLLILNNPSDGDAALVKKARNMYAGALKDMQWANRKGLDKAWSALLATGLARSINGKVSLLPVQDRA